MQLTTEQLQACDIEMRTAVPKVVGISSNGRIDFFSSSNPTQSEKNAAIVIMQKYITAPEIAHVSVDTDH